LHEPTRPEYIEYYWSGLHVTVTDGSLAGQHFANRTPLKINHAPNSTPIGTPPATPIIFSRAHNLMWITTTATNGAITNLSGLQTISGVPLKSGDLVLVKDQAQKAQNGVYVVKRGARTRAAFDPGPTASSEFHIYNWGRNWDVPGAPSGDVLTLGQWVRDPRAGTTQNGYTSQEPFRPLIYSASAIGTIKMIGNTCDFDYIGCGSPWGTDGLFWVIGDAGKTFAMGNDLRNFRFECFQVTSPVTEMVANTFYTRKLNSVVALNISPQVDAPPNSLFSAVLANNDLDGCALLNRDQTGSSVPVLFDLNINGNMARNGGAIAIQHGRRVMISNNMIDGPGIQAVFAFSCTRNISVIGRSSDSGVILADLGSLKTGDKVAFWHSPPTLPAPLDIKTVYFVKIATGTKVFLYSDAALTKPVLVTQEFSASTYLFYNLDTYLSITGNVFSSVTPGYAGGTIQDGSGFPNPPNRPGSFGRIMISNNIISGDPWHIRIARPLAGTLMLAISDNLLTDAANNPPAAANSIDAFTDDGINCQGQSIIQWGMATNAGLTPSTAIGNSIVSRPP
jgi:hypothetical protein